jgi:hypothetical protein
MSNMFSPAKAFFLILAVSLVPQFSLQVLAQDIDPPPAPEAPKPVQKEEEVIGTSPALERYQECFQQMIDAGISDNQYMRECLDIDDVKKPTPGSTAKLSEQEATSVVMGGVKPLEVCYQGLLDRSKSLSLVPEGMINPHLTLGPKGEVTEVKFETGQIVDLTLLECFKSNLKILNFKKATPGTSLRLQYRLSAVGSKKSARVALAKGFPKMVGPSYSLSDQDILAVFRRHAPKVRACYEDLLKTAPKATGQIAVDLVVKANGRVKKVVYKENTLTDKKFKSCVSTQLKNFVFPKSGSSADTIVKYPPFVFSPGQINQ